MAKSKDDIKYGTAQAKLSPDEALRVAYKHGTPLEGGKISRSERVDLFSSAQNIPKSDQQQQSSDSNQSQLQRDDTTGEGDCTDFTTGAPCLPEKNKPPTLGHKF
ncbi:SEED MATURATION PROTEIN 1-like [Vicia villosa]|uniref:SEED MATURATION PROTEIN 1-like n=1 Tax=Vicia villosa TaxID=3911 RepID=UPI00273AD63A|nr:SEED MATURATION PROTEIN 1-like [Vicia villosa]